MMSKRTRDGFIPVALAIFSMTLLSGCAHADSVAWEGFVMTLLRTGAAALLL
jgi:hypothetical protein